MKQEIDPRQTARADAFELWMSSPMPMVTLTKTFDVTRLYKMSKRKGMKFNMLLCWYIGKVASKIAEFYDLPIGGKLYHFDQLAVNVIVSNCRGGINSCDIPFSDDLQQFNHRYLELTEQAANDYKSSYLDDCMIIGTSGIIQTEIDCIVNQYTDQFNNPMVMWGKYRKGVFKTTLPISFQFHHVQMDGGQAAQFLDNLQRIMSSRL